MSNPNLAAAKTFLAWLFDRACEDGYYLSIFAKPSNACLFLQDVDAAAERAIAMSASQCVYVNGAVFKNPPSSGRGSSEDAAGMVGLRVDMDYGQSGHKGKTYPPDLATARALLSATGLEPSVVVSSGNGLHGWWLFKEPWLCLPPDEAGTRREIQRLARAWHETLKVIAASRGYALDSVFDLTRVLRIPGTLNHKDKANPKPVTLLYPDVGEPVRYCRDDFEALLVAEESWRSGNVRYEPVQPVQPRRDITVDQPPPRVALLMENDRKFVDTILRRRADMRDQSPSAYDMALVNILVRADCTDQEIADILLWCRKKNGEDIKKALRRDYLMTTIGKARRDLARAKAQDEITIPPPLPKDASKEEREERKDKNLEYVVKTLGVSVVRVIRHGAEDSRYEIVLEDGTNIGIGDAGQLLSQDAVRKKILDQAGIMIEVMKKGVWLKAVSALRQLAETVLDAESTRKGMIESWVRQYCFNYTLADEEDEDGPERVAEAIGTGRPFVKGGDVYLHVPDFGKYLRSEMDERASNLDLRQLLRLIGWRQIKVYGTANGRTARMCRSYWHGKVEDYEHKKSGSEAGISPAEGEVK